MLKEEQAGGHTQDITAGVVHFQDEISHLEEINHQLDDALADAEASVRR